VGIAWESHTDRIHVDVDARRQRALEYLKDEQGNCRFKIDRGDAWMVDRTRRIIWIDTSYEGRAAQYASEAIDRILSWEGHETADQEQNVLDKLASGKQGGLSSGILRSSGDQNMSVGQGLEGLPGEIKVMVGGAILIVATNAVAGPALKGAFQLIKAGYHYVKPVVGKGAQRLANGGRQIIFGKPVPARAAPAAPPTAPAPATPAPAPKAPIVSVAPVRPTVHQPVADAISKARSRAGGIAGDCEISVFTLEKDLPGGKPLRLSIGEQGFHRVYIHDTKVIDAVAGQYTRSPAVLKRVEQAGLKPALESGSFTVEEHIQFMRIVRGERFTPQDYIPKGR